MSEYDYLVHLIKCAIHNSQPDEKPDGLFFADIYRCSALHDVANIAFYSIQKLKKKPTEKLYKAWEQKCYNAVQRDIYQANARSKIVEAFANAGIRSLEIQGTKFKPLYPNTEYRTMSDIDFIVDKANFEKSNDVIRSLGYDCDVFYNLESVATGAHQITVEIHTSFFDDSSEYLPLFKSTDPFEYSSETGEGLCREADTDTFYLYSVCHFLKHFKGRGCGIRRVLDMYYLKKNFFNKVDTQYIESALEKSGYSQTVNDVFRLADAWFGDGNDSSDLNKIKQFIYTSGIHGNTLNKSKNMMEKAETQGGNAKFKYFKRLLFPPKRDKSVPALKYWTLRIASAVRSPAKRKAAITIIKQGLKKQRP